MAKVRLASEQKKTTSPTAQEQDASLAMWLRMYERDEDVNLEAAQEALQIIRSRQKAQSSQDTTGTTMT